MKSKIFFGVLFLLILVNYVSATPVSDDFLREHLILELPEITSYLFHDRDYYPEQDMYRLNVRYNGDENYYQKSEFMVTIYNHSLEDSFLENQLSGLWDFSLIEINENKIYEGTLEESSGIARTVMWISNNVSIEAWNGDDIGSIYDDDLLDALTMAYLQKYPSTYGCGDDCPSPCTNECSPTGLKECSGNGFKTCGEFDSDSCLEWSSVTNCESNQVCSNGICITNPPSCTNECLTSGKKRCEDDKSQTCGNYDNDECLEWNFGMVCPYGCTNGICDYILEEQENVTIFYYIEPNESSGPLEMPSEISSQGTLVCSGCEFDTKCYPYGYRKEGKFCSDSNNLFIEQKKADATCENNFECKTNICIDGQCISKGIWQKFLDWFRRLFG
jgi:hypothetical protein